MVYEIASYIAAGCALLLAGYVYGRWVEGRRNPALNPSPDSPIPFGLRLGTTAKGWTVTGIESRGSFMHNGIDNEWTISIKNAKTDEAINARQLRRGWENAANQDSRIKT